MDKGSEERSTSERIIRALLFMHLIEPAAVLGPNHCPTSLPSFFPSRAIRCMLNGQSEDGESKNRIRIWMYAEQSAVCTGSDVKAAAKLRRVRDSDESQKHTYLIPSEGILVKSQAMTALAVAYTPTGVSCPSFLATGHHRSEGGRGSEIWPPLAATQLAHAQTRYSEVG